MSFTKEEIEAAKETRDAVIEENIPELIAIYMAGEIVMWDELQAAICHRDEWVSVEDRLPDAHIIDGKKKKLNWVLGTNGKNQFVCVYTKGHEIEYGDDDPSDEEYDEIEDNNGCLYLKPGWYELEETPRGEYDETWVTRTPTHWLPLPTSPTK